MSCGRNICEPTMWTRGCSQNEKKERTSMKKTISLLLAAVCLLSVLAGCGGKKEMDPKALVDELLSGAGFVDSMNQISDAVVPIIYEVDQADYSSAVVYCGTAATAEEIAVFQAVDSSAADRLLEAAKTRVQRQIESYASYGPEAARTLENGIVERSGNYVIVVICADHAGAKKIVDKYI